MGNCVSSSNTGEYFIPTGDVSDSEDISNRRENTKILRCFPIPKLRNSSRREKKEKSLTGFHDLPTELWLLIFRELKTMNVLKCKKVSRLFYRKIDDIWYHIPRPWMSMYLNFRYGTEKREREKEEDRRFWTIHARTIHDEHNSYACKGFYFTYFQNGILSITEELLEGKTSGREPIQLQNCKEILEARGFPGALQKEHNYGEQYEYVLRVELPTWTAALKECLQMLMDTRYRFKFAAQDSAENGPDLPSIQLFHKIIEEFIRREPVTVGIYTLWHWYSQWLTPIFYDSLRKIEDQNLRIIQGHGEGGCTGWTFEFADFYHEFWDLLHNKTVFKTRETGRQTHMLSVCFSLPPTEVPPLIEMAVSHVIEIDIVPDIGSIIPGIVETLVRQWSTGNRVIKKFTIDLKRYVDTNRDYRLDILRILSDFSPISLGRRADYLERFWIDSRSPGTNGLLIQLEFALREDNLTTVVGSSNSKFQYVIQECALFQRPEEFISSKESFEMK